MVALIYLDRQVAVAVKPAGIPTQEVEGTSEHFTQQVIEAIKEKEGREKVYLHPVHRLDTPTSGLVLFARTSKALSRLQEALRNKRWHKIYIAEVEGSLKPAEGVFEDYLFHASNRSVVVDKGVKEAKLAVLRYEVLEDKKKTTRVRVWLETGRYHQIRCQFADRGHPIMGDRKYGSRFETPILHLHHASLTFPHPIDGREITVESPPSF